MGDGSRRPETEEFSEVDTTDRDPRGRKKKARRGRSRGGGGGRPRTEGVGRAWRIARVAVGTLLALAILVGLGGAGVFLYYGSDPNLPNLKKIGDYRPPQLTRVLDRNGKLVGTLGPERRTVVPYSRIPKHFIQAVVAAEDPSFFEHQGVDFKGAFRAFIENVLGGRVGPGRWGQGGSTITQQVVKWLVLSPEKTVRRKVQEIILARRLSDQLSKEEILSIYLNHINYGEGHYGCEAAAQYYFGKSIDEVDLAEASFLAGVPQRPERHSPHKNPESAKNRQLYVLRQMVAHGYVDRATADRLAKQPIQVLPASRGETGQAPEAVGAIYRLLVERYGAEALATLGAEVQTTIDLDLQKLARQTLERGLEELDERQRYRGPLPARSAKALEKHRAALKAARKGVLRPSEIVEGIVERVEKNPGDPSLGKIFVDVGGLVGVVDVAFEARYTRSAKPKPLIERFKPGDLVRVRAAPERRRPGEKGKGELLLALELGPQAAMVVIDPRTREVLALVGGYDFRPGGFDRSQRALRQAGSAIKPFVYAAALDSGRYTAASLVNDAPEVYDLWKPQNYQRESFRGPVRLRVALAESINTVAIRVLADVGIPAVIDLAGRAGIATAMPPDIGLSLALGANSVTPIELANAYATFVAGGQRQATRLLTSIDGEAVLAADEPLLAFKPETAYVMVSLMRSVVTEGTARVAGAKINRPLGGKTGTSNGDKDAWFVGFSPDLLAAVWVGFDDGKSLGRGEAGGRTAVPIWTEFMAKALAERPVQDFPIPPAISVVRIDPLTGLLPAPGAEGIEEVFLEGTAPQESSGTEVDGSSADRLLLNP
jgi:penicillin-binding protein 1A